MNRESSLFYAVFDGATNNLLKEFDTRAEAEAFIEKIKPYGRYGSGGHKFTIVVCDLKTGKPVDA